MKKAAAILILAGLVAAVLYSKDRAGQWIESMFPHKEEQPVPTSRVEKRTYTIVVPAQGELTGLDLTPVQAPRLRLNGPMKLGWIADEGAIVEKGDLLVRFDNTDALLSLEQNQNTVESYKQRIDMTGEDNRSQKEILGMDLQQADLQLEYANRQVRQDETIFSQWEIRESVVSAALASFKKEIIGSKGDIRGRVSGADLQILEIEKGKALNEVQIAEESLSKLEIRSPVSGIVIYKRRGFNPIEVGTEVWPGSPILELAAVHRFQGQINVVESEIADVEEECAVDLELGAFPGQTFAGHIKTVAKAPQQLSREDPRKYFACQVVLDIPIEVMRQLKPGMGVRGRIRVAERDNAFILPKSAVIKKEDRFLVFVQEGGKFVEKEVHISDSDHGFYVVEGIEDGNRVALRHPYEEQQLHLPDFNAPAGAGTSTQRFIIFG